MSKKTIPATRSTRTKSTSPTTRKPGIQVARASKRSSKAAAARRRNVTASPTKEGSASSPKRRSALDAAAVVLAKVKKPMNVKGIVEAMAVTGLWKSPGGKTPEATLYAAVHREIKTQGKAARFRKVERGMFEATGR